MEVEIDELEAGGSILKKVKHNEEVMKPSSEAGTSGSLNSENVNSDVLYHDYNADGNDLIDEDYASDYDQDADYMFENIEDDDEAEYLSMQAQFDNVDLPPGVEASFAWLKDPPSVPSTSDPAATAVPPVESHGSSSPLIPKLSGATEAEGPTEEEVERRFERFKSFDIVGDCSDHHFSRVGFQGQQPPRTWSKKIQDEWKMLENDLPDTIFVRAYETRMDLLRAVIIGPAGTPYHDGLFVFDIHFPTTYPDTPPMVYYYSGGLRLNPNLYNCGKVCLSLLNTWTGNGSEKWVPNTSTMLQVLVSIQALILNDKPFFNEPGYDNMYPGAEGEKKSKGYNEDIFILSLKTMIYTLRRPPKHFEDLVAGHFRSRAHTILSACRAYMEGVPVGSTGGGAAAANDTSGSKPFKAAVARMVNGLVSNFSRYGATDCDQFRV